MLNSNSRVTRTEVTDNVFALVDMIRHAKQINRNISSFHLQRWGSQTDQVTAVSYGFGNTTTMLPEFKEHEQAQIDEIFRLYADIIRDASWIHKWLYLRQGTHLLMSDKDRILIDYGKIWDMMQTANPNIMKLKSVNDYTDVVPVKMVEFYIGEVATLLLAVHPDANGEAIYTLKVLVHN